MLLFKGRPLGFSETSCHVFLTKESVGVYWHIGIVSTTQPLEDHDVLEACKILSHKQEALHMRIIPLDPNGHDGTKFQFKPMEDPDKIDFESTTIKHKQDWPALISHNHDNSKIDSTNGPLWRLILARIENVPDAGEYPFEYVMLFKFSHAIVDGHSAFDLLYRQFLPILSAQINGGDKDSVVTFVPQMRSAEELFLTPQTLRNPVPWYIKLGLDLFRWKNRAFKPAPKPVYRFPDDEILTEKQLAKEPECVPIMFGTDICGPVIAAAKAHGVTVHCVLLTAGAVALCRTADAAGIILPKTFKQTWPIDLRKFLDYTTPQPMGDAHGIGTTQHKKMSNCSIEEFWQSCQGIAAVVKTESGRKGCTKWLGLAKYFIDAARSTTLSSIIGEMAMDSIISISNLGNTSAGPQPKWTEGPLKIKLIEHYFTLSGIAKFDLGALSQFMVTFEKKFMWTVVYNPMRHSKKFVDTYFENLEDVLKTYCNQV